MPSEFSKDHEHFEYHTAKQLDGEQLYNAEEERIARDIKLFVAGIGAVLLAIVIVAGWLLIK